MREAQAKDEVIAAGKELVERGLVARTWGNVSCRIDEHSFAVTPSGIAYDRLTPDNIVVVDVNTLEYSGDVKPSSEKGIHAAAYRLESAVNFVIHTHQTYATCLSIAGFDSLSPRETETGILGGAISLAAYALPGTAKLKDNVEKALATGSGAVLMAHHGALVTGKDRAEAFTRAVTLEDVCRRAADHIPPPAPESALTTRRVNGSSFEIGKDAENVSGAKDTAGAEALHAALYKAYPDFNTIMHLETEAVFKVMESAKVLPAVLDDFAQIAGPDAKICPAPLSARKPEAAIAKIARALKGRNSVFVRGLGALCCAENDTDCAALLALVEKNALAYLFAASSGKVPELSLAERKLMRHVYVTQYSKKSEPRLKEPPLSEPARTGM